MTHLPEIWETVQNFLSPSRWTPLQEVYGHVQQAVLLDTEDDEPQAPGSKVPRWKRNVRAVFQYRKGTGEVDWNGKGQYRLKTVKVPKQQNQGTPSTSAHLGEVRSAEPILEKTTRHTTSSSVNHSVWENEEGFREGREKIALHRRKERNQKIVRRKKEQVLAIHGKLLCEACDFDFAATYGPLGDGFAECHHRVPIAQLSEEYRIRLSELVIVCANCHRMLHRRPVHTLEQLRTVVNGYRSVETDV